MRFVFAVVLCLFAGSVLAQVSTTRDTDYDWRCADAQGNRISDHQRYDTAFIACLNAPNGAYVQGGRYRINRTSTPEPVRAATLSWTPPTQNEDGTPLTTLAGYRISYGKTPTELTQTVQVANPGAKTFAVGDLAPGTWYFTIRAYTSTGKESAHSNIATKVVM